MKLKMGHAPANDLAKNCQGKITGYTGGPAAGQNKNWLSKFGIRATVNNPTALPLKQLTIKLVWVTR